MNSFTRALSQRITGVHVIGQALGLLIFYLLLFLFVFQGDIVRYYLYVYSSDSLSVEELMNTTEDADSSILWEPGASQGY